MTSSDYLTRPIILRARRDTLLLVALVTCLTFALSSSIHSRGVSTPAEPPQDWTGHLTDLVALAPPAETAPLTSASLVVPTSELALPDVPVRALVRLRGCDNSICPALPTKAAPSPPRRMMTAAQLDTMRRRRARAVVASNTNPLRHISDLITRPFVVAGDTVASWFKRF